MKTKTCYLTSLVLLILSAKYFLLTRPKLIEMYQKLAAEGPYTNSQDIIYVSILILAIIVFGVAYKSSKHKTF